MDERALIERAQRGEPAAERALFEQHVGRVIRMAHRMTGDAALAEDIAQDVFVRAFDRLASFEHRARFSTWLHTIAMSVTLNALRKRKRTHEHEHGVEDLEAMHAASLDPDRTLRLALHTAIDTLNEDMRVTFVLHDLEGYTHTEIAAVTGVEEGTSKARLSRARAKLREVLTDHDARSTRHDTDRPRHRAAGANPHDVTPDPSRERDR